MLHMRSSIDAYRIIAHVSYRGSPKVGVAANKMELKLLVFALEYYSSLLCTCSALASETNSTRRWNSKKYDMPGYT